MECQSSLHALHRRSLLRSAGGAAALIALGQTFAQTKPSQLKIVCGFAAGGSVDQLGRQVASKLQPGYVNSVIVDNRVGAAGQLAISNVKMLPPDGGTILVSPMVQFSLFAHAYKTLPYDPISDFIILTAASQIPFAYAIGPMVPSSVTTVKDYLAWVKTDAKHATFAVAGVVPQLIGMMLSKVSGVDMVPAMYRGGAPAALDTLSGNVPAVVTSVGDILPQLGEGKLRLLALASDKRHPLVPNVPTFAEQGISDMDHRLYYSFFARAGTPADIVNQHSAAIRSALKQKEVSDALARQSMEIVPADPKESAEILKRDRAKWTDVVKRIGYTPT